MPFPKLQLNQIKKLCLENKDILLALLLLTLAFFSLALDLPQEIAEKKNLGLHGTRTQVTKDTANEDHAEEGAGETPIEETLPEGNAAEVTPPPATTPNTAPAGAATTKIIKTEAQVASQTQTVPAAVRDEGLGIAAGGDLIYWDQERLDEYFQQLKDLGVSWVRWDVDWEVIQPYGLENYHWEGADRVAATAKKYGVHSLGIITFAPQWTQTKICPAGKHCPPADPAIFARFAGEVAARYRGTIDTWEIWNEPNYYIFWYPQPDAREYAELLQASYAAIKASNPSARVLSGGLASAEDEEGTALSPLTFLSTLYDAGAQNSFDILALHPYTYPGPSYSWQRITSVRNLMTENGDGAKPIWITEYGAPTGGSGRELEIGAGGGFDYGADFMSEQAQSQMAAEIFSFRREQPDRIAKIFWYNLRDTGEGRASSENFFGLLRYDGSPKPAYTTIHDLFLP